MSNKGEKICPLCAEEMDLTDQQLKPCKCGYEICVWCWHHILDMAEKDDTGGRCPACRVPYDKEKIVGMAANCERLVAESNMDKKMKNQKAKSKLSEGRKQLSDVRVIQQNLVYIVGLPLNLADENLLQQQDYFGQYGKVIKVSMSRTAAGVIQQFPNSTCSVYITFSKEDEAIRCIQSVHGFVLEGRPLRACFGTTKYCHAWLRKAPCSNPDCLYLHEVGSQEDSFTKDEIISAYTRSRVQQITGATNNMQQHSGNVLPPPIDDYLSHSSGKPIAKNASSNSSTYVKCSPPNESSGRSIVLPAAAAWGTRATSCQPHAGGLLCTNGPSKAKPDTVSSTLAFSSAVAGTIKASALHSGVNQRSISSDGNHIMLPRVKNESLNPVKEYNSMDNLCREGEKAANFNVSSVPVNLNSQLSQTLPRDSDRGNCTKVNTTNSPDIPRQLCRSGPEEVIAATNEEVQNLCCDMSSMNIDRDVPNEHHGITRPNSLPSDCKMIKSSLIKESQNDADKFRDALVNTVASKAATSDNGLCISMDQCDWRLDSHDHSVSNTTEVEDDTTSFDNLRFKDPEVCRSSYLPKSAHFVDVSNHSSPHFLQHGEPYSAKNAGSLSAVNKVGDDSLIHASGIVCNGYPEKLICSSSYGLINGTIEHSLVLQDERNEQCVRRFPSMAVNVRNDVAMDKGESSMISNILSMEFEPWQDSLTSPQNLAKLLGDNTYKQCDPLKQFNSWKVQNNIQSRFSFARQEESKIQTFNALPCVGVHEHLTTCSLIQDFAERDSYLHKSGIGNGFPISNLEESENLGSSHSVNSNKLPGFSRAQITAPPGFSVPSRATPPGFSSHETVEQAYDSLTGDIEFNDPAILAVGKGRFEGSLNSTGLDMRSNFAEQFNYFENEARLQLLMQQSLSQQQNLQFSEFGNTFSQLSDSYGLSSRLDQSQVSNLSPFPQFSSHQTSNANLSNGHWDGWNQVLSGGSLGVAELLRNERFGLYKFYAGYEDSKYRMQDSGDLYNRAYGM